MKAPDKILVAVTQRIGDVLLSTPLIRSLHRAWPEAKIDVLVLKHTEGILLHNPDIHRVITVPARPGFWAHLRLMLGLFRRYDLALTPLMNDRPTLYAWLAAGKRLGLQDDSKKNRWKRRLLTGFAAYDHLGTHTVLSNLGLADLLDIPRSYEVVAAWDKDDEKRVTGALPFEMKQAKFAVLHMSPKYPYKMWKKESWVKLSQWLANQGIRCVLTGSSAPEELAYIENIFGAMPSITVNLAGKLSLPESAYLLSRACCYVGPDTAITHVAAAVGTPTVALFGPSNLVKWGPWPKGYAKDQNPYLMRGSQRVNNVMVLQDERDCVPCLMEGCQRHINSLSDCLQEMPASRVIIALGELMNEPHSIPGAIK